MPFKIGASVQPGDPLGMLTINGNFYSGGSLLFDISGLGDGQYSMLNINGNATFTGGNVAFDFISGFKASPGNSWDFLLAYRIGGWNTLNFAMNDLGPGLDWKILDIDGDRRRFLITGAPVPLPATIWLFAPVLLGLAAITEKG